MFEYLSPENGGLRGTGVKLEGQTLVVGLGGLGIRTMEALRGRLAPEGSEVRFLAVDTDPIDLKRVPWAKCVNIYDPGMAHRLTQPAILRELPGFAWTDARGLPAFVPDFATAGLRQAGRCMLISKAAVCLSVLREILGGMSAVQPVEVYVAAGTTGGTGSGCLIDLCYMLHAAARQTERQVRVRGLLFLPDVTTPSENGAARQLALANATALDRDLRPLMYRAKKPAPFPWDTEGFVPACAPMERCVYISAEQSIQDWSVRRNSGLRTAVDYILGVRHNAAFAAHGAADGGFCRVISTATVLPYRASEYYLAMRQLQQKKKAELPAEDGQWLKQLKAEPKYLSAELHRMHDEVELPELEPQARRQLPPCPQGQLIAPWEEPARAWLARCEEQSEAYLCQIEDALPEQLKQWFLTFSEQAGTDSCPEALEHLCRECDAAIDECKWRADRLEESLQDDACAMAQEEQKMHALLGTSHYRAYRELALKFCLRRCEGLVLARMERFYVHLRACLLDMRKLLLPLLERFEQLLAYCRDHADVGNICNDGAVAATDPQLFSALDAASDGSWTPQLWQSLWDALSRDTPQAYRQFFSQLLQSRSDTAVDNYYLFGNLIQVPLRQTRQRLEANLPHSFHTQQDAGHIRMALIPTAYGITAGQLQLGYTACPVAGTDRLTVLELVSGGTDTLPYREQMQREWEHFPGTDLHIQKT